MATARAEQGRLAVRHAGQTAGRYVWRQSKPPQMPWVHAALPSKSRADRRRCCSSDVPSTRLATGHYNAVVFLDAVSRVTTFPTVTGIRYHLKQTRSWNTCLLIEAVRLGKKQEKALGDSELEVDLSQSCFSVCGLAAGSSYSTAGCMMHFCSSAYGNVFDSLANIPREVIVYTSLYG
jgi:hypothetical protein